MINEEFRYMPPYLLECNLCYHVTSDVARANPQVPCERCGQPGVRETFPDFVPMELLNLSKYFLWEATRHQEQQLKRLVTGIEQQLGVHCEPSALLAARQHAMQVHQTANGLSWTDETYQSMVNAIATELGISREAAVSVYPMLLFYRPDVEENVALVISVSTFIESMLTHLLIVIRILEDTSNADVTAEVEKLRGFGTHHRDRKSYLHYFHSHAGMALSDALQEIGQPSYYSDWADLREYRNDIVHGKLPLAPTKAAAQARNLALTAIPMFAALQNRFTLKSPAD